MSLQFDKEKAENTNFTKSEILVYLATLGVFDKIPLPDWAEGTLMFEPTWNALKMLGDGEWLEKFGYNEGTSANCDEWFRQFCAGVKVPTPSDKPSDWA